MRFKPMILFCPICGNEFVPRVYHEGLGLALVIYDHSIGCQVHARAANNVIFEVAFLKKYLIGLRDYNYGIGYNAFDLYLDSLQDLKRVVSKASTMINFK